MAIILVWADRTHHDERLEKFRRHRLTWSLVVLAGESLGGRRRGRPAPLHLLRSVQSPPRFEVAPENARAPVYPIAAVSKLTGVSCHTLRVWERRYGFPVPERTPSGHRRYRADQVGLIREIARRADRGEAVAQVIAETRGSQTRRSPERPVEGATSELISALMAPDFSTAEEVFQRAADGLSIAEVATSLIVPSLTESGEHLFRRSCQLAQERVASFFLLRKLSGLLDEAQQANRAPKGRVIVATLQGDRHEGGAAMLALALELGGWRALNLGADMPVGELQDAIHHWQPDAVGISLVLSRNIRKRFRELSELHGAPVFIGGRSALNYQGLARRCGLSVVLGPAIPGAVRFLEKAESKHGTSPRNQTADCPL